MTGKNVFFPFASTVVQTSTINDKFPLFKPVEECEEHVYRIVRHEISFDVEVSRVSCQLACG